MRSRVCLLWSMGAARDHSSGWRQDLSGLWRHGHATRLRWTEHHGAGRAKAEPLLGGNFLFSGPPRYSRKNSVLGRPGFLPVRKKIGEGALHVAFDQGGRGDADACTDVDVARRTRMAQSAKNLGPNACRIARSGSLREYAADTRSTF